MATISGSLSGQARETTAGALQGALVDLIDLHLQAKQAHWNVVGPHFRPVHLHLDELIDVAREHADTLAERCVAIGETPDGRPHTVANDANTPQLAAGYLKDQDVVAGMVRLLAIVIDRFRQRISDTADPDPVSQDLLISASHDLEKHHWMFQAQAAETLQVAASHQHDMHKAR